MHHKTNELIKAISELYKVNTITDFNKLTIEQRIYALLWCIYTNSNTSLTPSTITNLKTALTDLQVTLKDKIVIENIDSLSIDLHELNNVTSITSILDKLTALSSKDNTTNLDEVLTKLDSLIDKDYNTNFNDLSTKLSSLINLSNTDQLSNLLTTLNTTKINQLISNNYAISTTSLDYLADKLIAKLDNVHATVHSDNVSYETVLSNNTGVAATLSTPARDVGIYETASYLVVVTNMSTNNLPTKVQGSIDGINWTTVPLKYSNLSGNSSNIYTIPTNGTYLFSTEVLTKFVRLTISNIVTAKVTGQLFVK